MNTNIIDAKINTLQIDLGVESDEDMIYRKMVKDLFEVVMDLNGDFDYDADEVNTEYVRGQIELIANMPALKFQNEEVKDVLIEIVETLTGCTI